MDQNHLVQCEITKRGTADEKEEEEINHELLQALPPPKVMGDFVKLARGRTDEKFAGGRGTAVPNELRNRLVTVAQTNYLYIGNTCLKKKSNGSKDKGLKGSCHDDYKKLARNLRRSVKSAEVVSESERKVLRRNKEFAREANEDEER
ncbi:unnamed protein product [Soboliphyme baturini]|uniref:40S ribosomal protein S19-binding protein 1 n=1 Tax=Soboliphyme baturini TaxID=241478 RepID=A0A183IHD4_9BILA|nr:unnamed protein product [Soboliphyme baturini]